MVIMSHFVSLCSVRLGAIVTGVLSIIQAIVFLIILFLIEVQTLKLNAYEEEENQAEQANTGFFDKIINELEKAAEDIQMFLAAYFCLYIIACVMVMVGAFKLNKWLLLPFVVLDAGRIILIFWIHVIAMITLKVKMNLGELITASVGGGFAILLLGYLWACVVSLFQIIQIIKTDRYQALYGHLSNSDRDVAGATKFSVKPPEQTLKINVIDNTSLYPAIKDLSKSQSLMKRNFIQNNNLINNYNTSSNYISNYQYSNYTDGYYNDYVRK